MRNRYRTIRNYITFYLRHIGGMICCIPFRRKKNELIDRCIEQGVNSIPVFIISFNRLSYLKQFIEQMERYGITNLHIIDNASTYKPLLEYYDTIPYEVIREKTNMGYKVFWKDDRLAQYRDSFYVVTDPDLSIIEDCPKDFLFLFLRLIRKYPFARKVGFSLRIDDLPENGKMTNEVIKWEKQFYRVFVRKDNVFHARIDTTFALYVPDMFALGSNPLVGLRAGFPYQMRHLPWYKSENDIDCEDIFYSNNKTNGWSDPVVGFYPD